MAAGSSFLFFEVLTIYCGTMWYAICIVDNEADCKNWELLFLSLGVISNPLVVCISYMLEVLVVFLFM
jgi:hypothetical protein